jgi:hypothetical protein
MHLLYSKCVSTSQFPYNDDVEVTRSSWIHEKERGGVVTSTGGEVTPGRRKRGNDTSWSDANLTVPKNTINGR